MERQLDKFITQLDKFITQLEHKTAPHGCPRCATNNFDVLVDSLGKLTVDSITNAGGTARHEISFVTVICKNCGFIAQHSIAAFEHSEDNATGDAND